MATLNLGRIKPVFRGAYAGGTGYVVDDIVTSGNETFICILASTGNATSNATYWTKLAAKGTDGTDVGTTITTQGDILYRDGSGLQRLAKGTAAQQLAMNAGATAPEWITAAGGGLRYLDGANFSDVAGFYADLGDTIYHHHRLLVRCRGHASSSHQLRLHYRNTSDVVETGSVYSWHVEGGNTSGSTWSGDGSENNSYIKMTRDGLRDDRWGITTMDFSSLKIAEAAKSCTSVDVRPQHDAVNRGLISYGGGVCNTADIMNAIYFHCNGTNITGSYRLYGYSND